MRDKSFAKKELVPAAHPGMSVALKAGRVARPRAARNGPESNA